LELLSDEEYRGLQNTLAEDPECGNLIKGGGGIRKVRHAMQGRGKSGGVRAIYTQRQAPDLHAGRLPEVQEGRSERQGNSHLARTGQGVVNMEKTLFEELVGSLNEAKAIAKGRAKPSRRFELTAPDAKAVREQTGLSQSDFAKLMRVSVNTLQNWEQHRRKPTGPAAALLKIVSTAPKVALKLLHG
jgi:putative transcriptional regulator